MLLSPAHEAGIWLEAVRIAPRYYSPSLPYHNFDHAMQAVADGRSILRRCAHENVPVHELTVLLALLFHDIEYHRDHTLLGFASKELFAATLTSSLLLKIDAPHHLATRVADTILATHRDAPFTTNEQKVVRAADLAGIAGSYDAFLRNALLLKREAEILSRTTMDWATWKTHVRHTVNFYCSQDIHLTSGHNGADGTSSFHRRAAENVGRFLMETDATLNQLTRSQLH